MQMIKRWIARWAREGHESEIGECARPTAIGVASYDTDPDLNITVKAAIGGRIVQFRHYDHAKDRSTSRTYIITDDEHFESSLGKIITMESMRI